MNKNIRKLIFLAIVCIIPVLPAGCWSNRPLNTIGITVAVGFDQVDPDKIRFTIQVVKPSEMAIERPSQQKPVWVMSNTSETVLNAGVDLFREKMNKKIYINHIQLMVIGEKQARAGIADILDFWERDHEANIRSRVIIARESTASRILEAESELAAIPAVHIVDTIKNIKTSSKMVDLTLFETLSILNNDGQDLLLGVIRIYGQTGKPDLNNMDLGGGAVFRKDKLVGWLSPTETRGALMIMNKTRGGVYEIPNPQAPDKTLTVEIMGTRTKTGVQLKDNKPFYKVSIKQRVYLGEIHGEQVLTSEEMINKLQQAAANTIREDIERVLEKAQHEYQSDIFGFGDMLKRKYPDYWKSVQETWREEFQQVPVELEVEVVIDKLGRITERGKVW